MNLNPGTSAMPVIGYGEDGLTCWALTRHLSIVAGVLEPTDQNSPENCILFFRPSFGRKGGPKRSEFGEFDSILLTKQNAYLFEGKWQETAEFIGSHPGALLLDEVQFTRHRILRWISRRWHDEGWHQRPSPAWEAYYMAHEASFAAEFGGKPLVKPTARQSRNLEYLLRQIGEREIRDVLLYFHSSNHPRAESVMQKVGKGRDKSAVRGRLDFHLVCLKYEALRPSLYFDWWSSTGVDLRSSNRNIR
jgi:hypothetical protein